MNLALKDIRHNLGRFLLTMAGLGMLLMIIIGMGGIYRGIVEDATLLIDRIGADLWIVQHDTRGPFAELSRLPANVVHRARTVPDVSSAREFVFHTIQRERNGKPFRMSVLGLSWPEDDQHWVPLIAGRPLAQSHFEMIADESLGLRLDERLTLGKETYRVVGITRSMISSGGDGIAFFTAADAAAIQFDSSGEAVRLEQAARRNRGEQSELGTKQPTLVEQASKPSSELPAIARRQVSSIIVRVSPGASVEQVAKTISGWGDVSVHTRAEQTEFLLKGSVDKARRQIGLFRVLLTVIAAVIMALILYTLTLDKVHTIALLKLIGAPNTVILSLILQQALVLGGVGFGIAFLLGQQLFPLFPRRVIVTNEDLLQLAGLVLAISVASSLLGIWKAMLVQPNEALS